MKKIFYTIAAFALTTVSAFACDDSLSIKLNTRGEFKFWEGLDIGVSGYLTPSNSLTVPSGSPFLELDYARSRSIAWNMGQFNLPIVKNYVQLVTGIGLEWKSYAFRNNWTLNSDSPTVSATEENLDFSKNKLRTTWINVPLLLEFNTSRNEDKSFHLAAGVTGSYNIFRNRLKQEYEIDGFEGDRKIKDDFNINPFRCQLTARLGYGDFGIFANYQLNEMFKDNRGPELYPFSAGFSLIF
jgi:hypothetical protein